MRFSQTVMRGNSLRPSGESARPIETRWAEPVPSMRRPSIRMLPDETFFRPISALSVVLLPAPLEPTSATIRPAGTVKLTPCSASTSP